jgi:acetolactate synthase-1/2/3 large subunit
LAEPWEPWIAALGDALPAGATVVGDLTRACYYGMARTLPLAPPARLLYPSGLGTLGYAVPAAVGAALADPPGPVVAWCGDGGLMFTVAELAAAAQLGLALPIIVTVNQGWGQIRNVMEDAGFAPAAVTFPPPDLPLLARSLGGHGTVLRDPAELAPALRAALGADRPTLIAIPEPPDASSLRSDRTEPT